MKLFNYSNYSLKVSEEAFSIKAFRDLVKRDRSAEKSRAMLELGYIYFMCDARSDYRDYPEEEKSLAIINETGLPSDWRPDAKVRVAMEVYKRLTDTVSARLLKNSEKAANEISTYLGDISLSELPLEKRAKIADQIMGILNKVPDAMKKLADAEKTYSQEILEGGRRRADREKTIAEDGIEQFLS